MQVRIGEYTGNGSARSITGTGPVDLVFIRARASTEVVMKMASLSGDGAWLVGSIAAPTTGLITSIDSDGFSLGTDTRVNDTGVVYDWVVLRAQAGASAQGSYTGNGVDNRDITGMGCDPAFVVLAKATSNQVLCRTSDFPGDLTGALRSATHSANLIRALQSDGMRVSSNTQVNASGVGYHYFASEEIAGVFKVFTWTGNGSDNRSISGVGFQPDWSGVLRTGINPTLRNPAHSGDESTSWEAQTYNQANRIQAHESDGIQVGTNNSVNASGVSYYAFAFRELLTQTTTLDPLSFSWGVPDVTASPGPVTTSLNPIAFSWVVPDVTAEVSFRRNIPVTVSLAADPSITVSQASYEIEVS